MHLTTDQIDYIDYVLRNDYSFEKFDDLRIELLDHIASDVESLMERKQICFEVALPEIFQRWNDEIAWDCNSKYKTVPKMVSNLWGKLDWKYNYCIVPLTAIICFITILYRKETWVTFAMYLLGCVGLILGIYLLNLFKKNQFNTVLSVYAKKQIEIYVGLLALALISNLAFNYNYGDFFDRPVMFVVLQFSLILIMRTIIMRKNIKIDICLLKVI